MLVTYHPSLAAKKAKVSINEEAVEKALKFTGYDLLVTSEIK